MDHLLSFATKKKSGSKCLLLYHSLIKLPVIIYHKENKFYDHTKPSIILEEREGRREGGKQEGEREMKNTIYA